MDLWICEMDLWEFRIQPCRVGEVAQQKRCYTATLNHWLELIYLLLNLHFYLFHLDSTTPWHLLKEVIYNVCKFGTRSTALQSSKVDERSAKFLHVVVKLKELIATRAEQERDWTHHQHFNPVKCGRVWSAKIGELDFAPSLTSVEPRVTFCLVHAARFCFSAVEGRTPPAPQTCFICVKSNSVKLRGCQVRLYAWTSFTQNGPSRTHSQLGKLVEQGTNLATR